MCCGT